LILLYKLCNCLPFGFPTPSEFKGWGQFEAMLFTLGALALKSSDFCNVRVSISEILKFIGNNSIFGLIFLTRTWPQLNRKKISRAKNNGMME
jgi:hypothetical protein